MSVICVCIPEAMVLTLRCAQVLFDGSATSTVPT